MAKLKQELECEKEKRRTELGEIYNKIKKNRAKKVGKTGPNGQTN